MLLLGLLTFAEANAQGLKQGSSEPPPEAAAHFRTGVEHLKSKDPARYAAAYREFKAAYAIVPKWTILGNLGIAAMFIERYGEAEDAFEGFLEQGGSEVSGRERAQFERDLATVRSELATVRVEAGSGAFWIVDTRLVPGGEPVVNEYGPFEGRAELRVRQGRHEFQLEREGGPRGLPWAVSLLAGDSATHHFAPPPEPVSQALALEQSPMIEPKPARREDAARPSRIVPYVLWGSGAAAAGAAAFFYLRSRGFQNDADDAFERACPLGLADPDCVPTGALDARAAMSAADTKAAHWGTAALVTGIGAAGALITGTVLYFAMEGPSEERSLNAAAGLEPSVNAWVSPTGIGLSGHF